MTNQMQCLAIWSPGPLEIIIILVIALLLFGRRLPEIARSVGKSLTEFKRGMKETKEDIEKAVDADEIARTDDEKQRKQD